MSCDFSASDHTPVSEGPSERDLKWSQAWKQSSYRAWPPPNTESYPVWTPTHMDRMAVAHVSAAPNPDEERDRASTRSARGLRIKWQQLADSKCHVSGLRSRVKQARTRTLRARAECEAADNAFMSAIRPLSTCSPSARLSLSSAQFHELFRDLQEARNRCQDRELSMAGLEGNMEAAERHLDFSERQLINELPLLEPTNIVATRTPLPDMLWDVDVDPAMESQTLYQHPMNTITQSDLLLGLEIKPDSTEDHTYQELIFTVKAHQSARNYRDKMLTRKEKVEAHNRHLKFIEKYHPAALHYVTQLRDSDLEFLLEFDAEESKVLDEIRRLSQEMNRLVQLCWQNGCWSQDIPLDHVMSWYQRGSLDLDHDLVQAGRTTTSTEFSILLSNPIHLVDVLPDILSRTARESRSTPEGHTLKKAIAKELFATRLFDHGRDWDKLDYIDGWLLQRLRTSPLEVDLLYSTYLMEDAIDILDIDEWQEGVLSRWWTDEAGKTHFQNLRNFPGRDSSATSPPSSPPSWFSEPMIWSSEASEAEVDVYTGPISGADDHQPASSGSEMSLDTTKILELPPEINQA